MIVDDLPASKKEMAALFRVIKSRRDRCLFRLIYAFGLTELEITRLRLVDLHGKDAFNFSRITVHGNRLGGFWVFALPPSVARSLRSWVKIRGRAPGPLFVSRFAPKGITRRQIVELWRAYSDESGIKATLQSIRKAAEYERLKDWR